MENPAVNLDLLTRPQLINLASSENLLSYEPCSDLHRKFHFSTANIRAIFGGNRSGKTTTACVDLIWQALGLHPVWSAIHKPPLRCRVVATDYLNGIKKVIIPKLYEWLPKNKIKDYRKDEQAIILKNGSTIDLKSNDQEVIKMGGVPMDLTWFDEPPRYDIWSECQMRHIDTHGSTILSMTPLTAGGSGGEDSWIYNDIYERDGTRGIECFTIPIYKNPHLSRAMIDVISANLDETEREIRLFGKFKSLSGRVFKDLDPAIHAVDDFDIHEIERKTGQAWARFAGIDPHPNAPFSMLYMAIDPFGFKYFYDEISLDKIKLSDIAKIIKAKEGKDRIYWRVIDPRAGHVENNLMSTPSVKDLLQKHGIYCRDGVSNFDAFYHQFMEDLSPRAMLTGQRRPMAYFFKKGAAVALRQFNHYVWDRPFINANLKDPKQTPREKESHLVDCARYIYNSTPRWFDEKMEQANNERFRRERKYHVVQ